MKVEVHIDSHFQEEAVTITAPTLSTRVERIRDFVEELDQKGRLRAKKDGEAYLIESQLFQRFYIENRQVIGETMTDQFILTGPLYQLSEDTSHDSGKVCIQHGIFTYHVSAKCE